MTIEGDNVNMLDFEVNPKPKYANFKLSEKTVNNKLSFDVMKNGSAIGTLYPQKEKIFTNISARRFTWIQKGRRDEHALAYGILFIIIVLSVAIYYTKF